MIKAKNKHKNVPKANLRHVKNETLTQMKVKMFESQRTSLLKLSHYNPTLRLDSRFFKINIVQIKKILIN